MSSSSPFLSASDLHGHDAPADCGPGVRRALVDRAGVRWEVWRCVPTSTKGGLTTTYASGWLTFESDRGEKRRVAPAPREWRTMTDDALRNLLATARPARQPRAGE